MFESCRAHSRRKSARVAGMTTFDGSSPSELPRAAAAHVGCGGELELRVRAPDSLHGTRQQVCAFAGEE
jgi:hypothetical protein